MQQIPLSRLLNIYHEKHKPYNVRLGTMLSTTLIKSTAEVHPLTIEMCDDTAEAMALKIIEDCQMDVNALTVIDDAYIKNYV